MHHKHASKHMGKRAYLIRHICATAIVTELFHGTMFCRSLCGRDRVDTVLLWILAVVCCAFGTLVTWKSRRRRELWLDVFAPAMIWIAVSWIETVPIPVVCAALSVPVIYFVFPRCAGTDDTRKALPFRTRYILFLRKFRRSGALAVSVLIVFLGIRGFWFTPTVDFPRASEREQITIETAIDELTQLEPDRWSTLDEEQKLAVLQTVADIEADAYGLPDRLIVRTKNLSAGTWAEYAHYRRSVTIDTRHLREEQADEVLRSVLHECRHAYQHQLVSLYDSAEDQHKDLLIFREADVSAIKDSFDNYVEGDRDYEYYLSQRCEADARAWADERYVVYYEAIRSHFPDAAAA